MKYAFISQEKVAYPVAVLCRVLAVSTSGYYASLRRPPSLRARRDRELVDEILRSHLASKRRYGSPRVYADLQAEGQRVGRKRVALMREHRLVARAHRRFRTTTDSKTPSLSLRTSWPATARRRRPTNAGSPTSRSCGPSRAGYISRSSSICYLDASSAGRPAPTSTGTWPWPRSTWRWSKGDHRRGCYIIRTAEAHTRRTTIARRS